MILKPKDINFILPELSEESVPADFFKYIADFNDLDFYETDLNGFVPNEIKVNYFFVDRVATASPELKGASYGRTKFDGVLFVGIPVEPEIDINKTDFTNGQFEGIIKELISAAFLKQLLSYLNCDYAFLLNTVKPVYNTNTWTRATNCTGVEINYSLWL